MRESELFARFAACYADLRALPRSARRALQRRIARSSELAAIFPEYLQHRGRRLQHRMAWSLAGAALLLALGQGVGAAATITVTTNNPNIIADGQCSLIEAIVNANNDAATFPDCAAGSGADTIVLPANANVTLSAVYAKTYGQFGNPVGLPLITSRITIEGNGATIARQGNAPAFGLMAVRGNVFQGVGVPPARGSDASECDSERRIFLRRFVEWWHCSASKTASSQAIRVAVYLIAAPSPSKTAPSQAIRVAVAYLTYGSLSRSTTAPSQAIQPSHGGGVISYSGYVAESSTSQSITAPSQAIPPIRAVGISNDSRCTAAICDTVHSATCKPHPQQ